MAVLKSIFLDTSVFVGGVLGASEETSAPRRVLAGIERRRLADLHTAWHCCLEFYSVMTRLPPASRISESQAAEMIHDMFFGSCEVHDLSGKARLPFIIESARDRVGGGRLYDAHIASVARQSGAATVVTENRRHFTSLLRHGVRVLDSAELAAEANL